MKMKTLMALALCCCAGLISTTGQATPPENRTVKGWFADESCTRGRVAEGNIEPNNPECAKRCVKEGSKLVFLSETDKAMFYVSNPADATQAIGYYVEVSGITDDKAKALKVNSIKKISEVNAFCARPKLKK